MNPSYCRIRVPKDEAIRRFARWNRIPQIGPLTPTDSSKAIRLAVDDRGRWRGKAVFVSDLSDWTLFQDLSGGLSAIPASSWLEFADHDDLIFAGYNDAIPYGELVAISGGRVQCEFLDDPTSPEANKRFGSLPGYKPFAGWIDAASFVDGDEMAFRDKGWLWVY